jgi:hypothetical protein
MIESPANVEKAGIENEPSLTKGAAIQTDYGKGGAMKTLLDRLSYWMEERFAVLEDNTEGAVVPPMDSTLERLAAACDSVKERLSSISWRRGGVR